MLSIQGSSAANTESLLIPSQSLSSQSQPLSPAISQLPPPSSLSSQLLLPSVTRSPTALVATTPSPASAMSRSSVRVPELDQPTYALAGHEGQSQREAVSEERKEGMDG